MVLYGLDLLHLDGVETLAIVLDHHLDLGDLRSKIFVNFFVDNLELARRFFQHPCMLILLLLKAGLHIAESGDNVVLQGLKLERLGLLLFCFLSTPLSAFFSASVRAVLGSLVVINDHIFTEEVSKAGHCAILLLNEVLIGELVSNERFEPFVKLLTVCHDFVRQLGFGTADLSVDVVEDDLADLHLRKLFVHFLLLVLHELESGFSLNFRSVKLIIHIVPNLLDFVLIDIAIVVQVPGHLVFHHDEFLVVRCDKGQHLLRETLKEAFYVEEVVNGDKLLLFQDLDRLRRRYGLVLPLGRVYNCQLSGTELVFVHVVEHGSKLVGFSVPGVARLNIYSCSSFLHQSIYY